MVGAQVKFQRINNSNRRGIWIYPKKKLKLYNCVGGGSSSYGLGEFMDYDKNQVELIGVEAGGPKSKNMRLH